MIFLRFGAVWGAVESVEAGSDEMSSARHRLSASRDSSNQRLLPPEEKLTKQKGLLTGGSQVYPLHPRVDHGRGGAGGVAG